MELDYHRGGAGEPLLLIHGIGMSWRAWRPVLPLLEREREVIAIDLPGFGSSPMPPPGTPPGIVSLTRLVAEFLDGLGIERPHAAGNSLGGWLALELAKQARARSATALSPAGFHNAAESVFQRSSLVATYRGVRLLRRHADRLAASPLARTLLGSQYFRHPKRFTPAEFAQNLRALADAPWFDETRRAINRDHFRDGEQIEVPVTIAWGEYDRLLLPRQAQRAVAMIPGARSVTLTGCGHVPMSDDPEQVARVLLEASAVARGGR